MKHFEIILRQNRFDLKVEGEPQLLSKEQKQVQRDIVEEIVEEHFEQFLQTTDITQPNFKALLKHTTSQSSTLLTMKSSGNTKRNHYEQTPCPRTRLYQKVFVFMNTKHIDEHLAELSATSIDAKLLTNGYQQMKVIKESESKHGLSLFTLGPCGLLRSEQGVNTTNLYPKGRTPRRYMWTMVFRSL